MNPGEMAEWSVTTMDFIKERRKKEDFNYMGNKGRNNRNTFNKSNSNPKTKSEKFTDTCFRCGEKEIHMSRLNNFR